MVQTVSSAMNWMVRSLFPLVFASTWVLACGDDGGEGDATMDVDASTADDDADDDVDDGTDDDGPDDAAADDTAPDDDSAGAEPDAGSSADDDVDPPAPEPEVAPPADAGVEPEPGQDAGPAPEGNFGDVGQACDPESDADCNTACLELSDGSGVCIDDCFDGGAVDCPPDFMCNSIPLDGEIIDICLPNANCGELTFQGECDGSTLRFCDVDGPAEVDCSELASVNGEDLACAFIDDDIGYDCVSSSFTGGCGQVTAQGTCDDDVLSYCVSQQTGEVATVDCAESAEICAVAQDGVAACTAPGTSGCGAITFEGQCEGNLLTYCDESEIVTVDCSQTGECRWESDDIGFNCVAEQTEGGTNRVVGTWLFQKPALTVDGLGEVSELPIRHALVRVLRQADDTEVVRGYTEDDGSFQLSFDEAAEVYVDVVALGEASLRPVAVRNCPLLDCGGNGAIYAVSSAPFTPAPDIDLGPLVAQMTGNSGAFNIFDQCVRGADFAQANFGRPPPPHTVQWSFGSNTACGTSCFSVQDNTIFVLSTLQDTDEFDDPVLMHEYGHFLESAFSRSDSPGGQHDGSPTDPRLAWGEGYGTYVGARIAGSSLYIDSFASGASVTDINDIGLDVAIADPTSLRGMNQLLSEYLVAEVLWHIDQGSRSGTQAQGSEPIFDVLGGYFTSDDLLDRGVSGVELVDFLDGWFCRGHENQPIIAEIVNQDHGFPYDYPQLASCP